MAFPRSQGASGLFPEGGISISGRLLGLLVILFLAAHFALAVTAAREKSATSDEYTNQAAGYAIWKYHDFRLDPENGNLSHRLAALPLLFRDKGFPFGTPEWEAANLWQVAFEFFYQSNNPTEWMQIFGRMMVTLLSVAGGLLVFFWSRSLFGAAGGLVSLVLYAFSPTLLAHGSLMTADTAAGLSLLAAAGMTWRSFSRPGWGNVLGAGVAMGAALLAKMSGVLILPVASLLVAGRALGPGALEWNGREIQGRAARVLVLGGLLAAQGLLALVVIWGAYGFRYSATAVPGEARETLSRSFDQELRAAGRLAPVLGLLRQHRLAPEAFLYGFTYSLTHAGSRRAFMHGEYATTGWWTFFPFAVAVKTPVAVFPVLALAGWGLWKRRRVFPFKRLAPLGALFLVYAGFSLASHINIGHRHVLPLYPVAFILAGGAVLAAGKSIRRFSVALAAILALFAAESAAAWPNYLAFFNPASGGPSNGYRLLVDSSLDWGQDLPALKKWLDRESGKKQDKAPVYLSFFGSASPKYYGLNPYFLPSYCGAAVFEPIRPEPYVLTGGIYCISATLFQQVYTDTFGRWCEPYERAYQVSRAVFQKWAATLEDPEAARAFVREMGGEEKIKAYLDDYKRLRFGRLCHGLRQRKPDAFAGFSILIFRVYYEDLKGLLEGPAGDLPGDPGVRGPIPEITSKWMNYPDPLAREAAGP